MVDPTPGALQVDRSDKDLDVQCSKPGWFTASATIPTRYHEEGVVRLLSAGAAGLVQDAATSANFDYDTAPVTLRLQPTGG